MYTSAGGMASSMARGSISMEKLSGKHGLLAENISSNISSVNSDDGSWLMKNDRKQPIESVQVRITVNIVYDWYW